MAAPWDQRSAAEQARLQNMLLRQSVMQMALGNVPYVRALMAELRMDARTFRGLEELERIPLSMRRDVLDPGRNPAGAAGLILQGTDEGVKRLGDRLVLWHVALARLLGGEEGQRRAVEAATRPIHVHLAPGPGGPLPVAYTRDDLDALARAGARLAAVLGLSREDRLLNLVPFGPTLDFWGVFYMAHGFGMSAVHVRGEGAGLARALEAFAPQKATAVAVPADEAASFPRLAAEAGVDLGEVRLLVAVGRSLGAAERSEVADGLAERGAPEARVAAAYGLAEGRVLWGECAVPPGHPETFGFHTYPDMDLVEVVSPDTGGPAGEETAGEIVVTPLGFRGGGAPRWRSGDLAVGGVTRQRCPNCGRAVPRVGPSVLRGAWVRSVVADGRPVRLDLREAGAAAAARAPAWQLEIVSGRGSDELYVYLAPPSADAESIIDLYEDLERLGVAPAQIVLGSPEEIAQRLARADGPWGGFWERPRPPRRG